MMLSILLFLVVLLMHFIAITLALLGQINILKTMLLVFSFVYFFFLTPAMLTN